METIAVHSCKTGAVELRQRTAPEQAAIEDARTAQTTVPRPPSVADVIAALERKGVLTLEDVEAEMARRA